MGMFAKDKELGRTLDSVFEMRDEFILWGARVEPGPITDIGPSEKTVLEVSRLDHPDEKFEVNTLASAIAAKAKEATAGDFPCVVQLLKVESKTYGGKATVLQYVKDWGDQSTRQAAVADDDIPF
jgi:hypothetical protein